MPMITRIHPDPQGKFVARCRDHGETCAIYYGLYPYISREIAKERIGDFHVSHMRLRPDCMLDARVVEELIENGKPSGQHVS